MYDFSHQKNGKYFVFHVETGATYANDLSYDVAKRKCVALNEA